MASEQRALAKSEAEERSAPHRGASTRARARNMLRRVEDSTALGVRGSEAHARSCGAREVRRRAPSYDEREQQPCDSD